VEQTKKADSTGKRYTDIAKKEAQKRKLPKKIIGGLLVKKGGRKGER